MENEKEKAKEALDNFRKAARFKEAVDQAYEEAKQEVMSMVPGMGDEDAT